MSARAKPSLLTRQLTRTQVDHEAGSLFETAEHTAAGESGKRAGDAVAKEDPREGFGHDARESELAEILDGRFETHCLGELGLDDS
ncbi:MAG: hypothetical protein CL908_05305 [Deltaproteobacteria bacterium]|nr:hypothetical protein [Deltaproteobacteria bacterium]